MYAEWFRRKGYCTLQADSAGDAYRLAAELGPDVAVVDVALTGPEDGLHLTRRLKENQNTRDLPVVILSGHVFPADREEAERAGCDLFVPKPCRPDVLARAVDRLVNTHN